MPVVFDESVGVAAGAGRVPGVGDLRPDCAEACGWESSMEAESKRSALKFPDVNMRA